MYRKIYSRLVLVGLLMCLFAPAKVLIALPNEPFVKVNTMSKNNIDEHNTNADPERSASSRKVETFFAGWYDPEFSAVAITSSEIDVILTDRSYDDLRYEIHGDELTEVVTLSDSGRTITFRDDGLEPNTTYTYRLEAFTERYGSPVYTKTISVKTALEAPNFPPYAVNYEENNIAFAISGYSNLEGSIEIYRSLNSANGFQLIATVPWDQDEYYDANLKNNTRYYYKLRARVGSNVSEFSTPQGFRSFAKNVPPTIDTSILNDTTIQITFQDHSYNDVGYQILNISGQPDFYESFDMPDSGRVRVFYHYPVNPSTSYIYQVDVFTRSSDDYPYYEDVARDSVTTPPPANTPLKVPQFSYSYVRYDQNNIAFGIEGYNSRGNIEIFRSLNHNDGYSLIATVPDNQDEYYDANLKNNTTYYYKLRARDGAEVSDFSVKESFRSFAKNHPPTIDATILNDETVQITFQDHSYNDIEYDIDNGGDYPFFSEYFNLPDSGKVIVLYYYPASPSSTYTFTVNVRTQEDHEPNIYNVARDTVTTPPLANPCVGVGTIEREIWNNIPGTSIASIPFDSAPDNKYSYTSFEAPQFFGNNYGSRMRGYVCVPVTGLYVFWISSDDSSELLISWDDNPANKYKIASVTGHTGFRVWNKYTTQKSNFIYLEAGHKYYIEALHKEANGNDHISIGWQLPDGTLERPIPGNRLIPFTDLVVSSCADDPNLGSIQREIWRNIPGTSVSSIPLKSSIPLNSTPSNVVKLESFQTQTYYANNYGSRIRGYVCVPTTGDYTFWIASDDRSELWLSTDALPANTRKIAFVTGVTRVLEWTKYPWQQSAPVRLTAGQKYYIEALHREANGNDHIAVGWQLPNGNMERPIPGSRLVAYEDASLTTARVDTQVIEEIDLIDSDAFSLYPNPSPKREVTVVLDNDKIEELQEAEIEVVSVSGIVVHRGRIVCGVDCSNVLLSLHDNVPPGIYTVNVLNKGKRMSKRLMLK